MKNVDIITAIQKFSPTVRGVFTLSDLHAVLDTKHSRTFYLRLKMLEEQGILTRFARGVYITEGFNPAVLSQTLCPESCISFEYVLSRHLVTGSGPGNCVRAVKPGKKRLYTAPGTNISVEHLGLKVALCIGYTVDDGVRIATPEKAFLDTLYFHARGYVFNFDIYSDPDLSVLDFDLLNTYLALYENPKFIAFAKGCCMNFPDDITMDGLFLWLIHRISEEFGEKAILKGGMELRLLTFPVSLTISIMFLRHLIQKDISTMLDTIMSEIPDAKVSRRLHSKIIRYRIEVGDIAVQLEAGVASDCPSIAMSTASLSCKVNTLARIIRVMRLDVALAHKLTAWNERRLARDLYDIYCLHTLLGETPDRTTLQDRLARIESRLPVLRGIKQMDFLELSATLRREADGLTIEKIQPLESLLDAVACIGLEKKIRVALHSLADVLESW